MKTRGPAPHGTWRSRRGLAWTIRALTMLVPLAAAVVSMILVAMLIHRPQEGWAKLAWYVLLLAESWAVARLVSRLVDRSLPLAALLEMSLTFPESAPNRLGLAQRDGSAAMLARLAVSPPDETAQEAAERILRLLTALSSHDRFTRGHAERVRAYTDLIAERMELSSGDRDRLRWAALLHDIGKLQVPSALLNKPGKPTPGEWDVLRMHPVAGSVIAAPLLAWLSPMDRVIAEHHERWDGSGYPVGLAREDISFGARIVTVADSFEAMTATRAYSRPMKREEALREVVRCAGKQFDPAVVRAFLAVPQRRLAWAMGPAAWLTGLPVVSQGSLNIARTAGAHAGNVAIGATSIGVIALAPAAFASAPAVVAAPPAVVVPAASSAAPAAVLPAPATTASTATATAPVVRVTDVATPVPASTPAPVPAATRTKKAVVPRKAPVKKPAPRSAVVTTPPRLATPTHSAQPAPVKTDPGVVRTTPAAPTTPAPKPAKTPQPAKPKPKPEKPVPAAPPPPVTTSAAPSPAAQTPPPPVAPPAPPAPPYCSASYVVTSAKKDKFSAVATVRNTGAAATQGWSVTWTFGGKERVQSTNGANVQQTGQQVTATNVGSNGTIAPGGTASFSVTGSVDDKDSTMPTLSCTAT